MRFVFILFLVFVLLGSIWSPVIPNEVIYIPDPQAAYETAYGELAHLDYEGALIYFLDAENRAIQIARVSQGLPHGIYYVPWELVLPSRLPQGTMSIYLVHNHPGGNPRLSEEDITTRRFWAQKAHEQGIQFDLLAITASSGYTSLLEEGYFTPDSQEYGFFELLSYLIQPSLAMATDSLRRVLLTP